MKPATRPPLRLSTVIVGSLLLAICGWLFVRLPFIMEQFEQLFRGFGADLPQFTRWVISHVLFIWAVVLSTLIAQLILFVVYIVSRNPRVRRAFWILAFVDFAYGVAVIVAMYLPIFKLGAVV